MSNPTVPCIGCTQVDDHPRHSVQVGDNTWVDWHMDCHSTATGCESCTEHTTKSGGKTGDDFRAHLLKHYAATAKKLEN